MTNGTSSCAIETVGWILCPTLRSIAKLADYGFTYINKSFLKIEYSITSNDSGTYKAWEMMRNIANALFVIAFMILIYSQLTGRGGGYNIKRLVPKLVLSAILVNVSYFICVALIDVTNILGDSLLFLLASQNGIAGSVGRLIMPVDVPPVAFWDGTLTVITSSVLSKGGFAWVLIAPVTAVIVTVATISAVGIVLLIMRKVVVAMLILMSPILFVAYLLPNLERFFFQGIRLFIQLLMLYPIIAVLLGAGQIISATIVTVGTNDSTNYAVTGDFYFSRAMGSGSAITDTTAAAAAVLPLLAVWYVFKSMSSLMTTAGARLSATVAGRRGGKDEEKARVTGNASAGARNNNPLGNTGIPQQRRQAFSRNKRKSSLGGSSMYRDGEGLGDLGKSRRDSGAGGLNGAALSAALNGEQTPANLNNAEMNGQLNAEAAASERAETNTADINQAMANAMAGGSGEEKEKAKTAKDIFNNLNKQHESKDKDRKFGAGPGPAGSGGGGGSSSSGGAVPAAPTVQYKAPQMASSGNVVSGSSPKGGAAPVQVVAVPVSVDASTLINKPTPSTSAPDAITNPLQGTVGEKAKNRVQKYLFDTQKDTEDASNAQDILGRKDDNNGDDKDGK